MKKIITILDKIFIIALVFSMLYLTTSLVVPLPMPPFLTKWSEDYANAETQPLRDLSKSIGDFGDKYQSVIAERDSLQHLVDSLMKK